MDVFFVFPDPAFTEIYTLSLHDALPIWDPAQGETAGDVDRHPRKAPRLRARGGLQSRRVDGDRKSTRLNSSHLVISYAVFCLKKKNNDCLDVAVTTQHGHVTCAAP